MSEEKIHELEKKLDILLELVPQALIAARESTTPSFSEMMKGFTSRLESMEAKLDSHMERTQPVVDTIEIAQKSRKFVIWIAGFLLAVYPITNGFKALKDWLK